MFFMRKIVMFAGMLLFGVWMATHWARITGDEDAIIRLTLGILFAVIIIFRNKDLAKSRMKLPSWIVPIALVGGMVAVLVGMIFKIHIAEWIGVLLLLFACSVWVAPKHYGADILLAFVILFWMHPIPGQVFGWLQNGMQQLSIIWSETILHVANERVWGDLGAMVLRTGYQNFMVPESCSGMKTAVTVFLCTLGVGALLRLKWYEVLFFVFLGLLQVLILNVARISYMVIWAPQMPAEWAENFLHDTLGVFLMGAIILVQLEASWWRMWSRRRQAIREGIKKNEIERPDRASVVPHPLRRLIFVMTIMLAVGSIVAGVFGVIYKSRSYHRKEMIREVAEGLMQTDPVAADRAIKAALRLVPGDSELLSMQAHTDLIRGRFEDGLAILDAKEVAGESLSLEETVLKSWALMRLDRVSEAKKMVDALPPSADNRPGVAMLKAEFAARDGKPAEAGRYVILASRSFHMLRRVRGLFPYLAAHEQWNAIAVSDHDHPYDEVYQALIALRANQRIGDLAGVTRVMSQVIKLWPDDIRFLLDLYKLTLQGRGGDWEALFEHNLLANVGSMSISQLAIVQDYCWSIARPDLAWIVFSDLQKLDHRDPALLMAPAQYGHQWTLFRRHKINVIADSPTDRLNVMPVLEIFDECAPFKTFVKRIPLLREAGDSVDPNARRRYLDLCLAELKKREDKEPLNERLLRLYPIVLVMSDKFDEAHKRLDGMLETHPEKTESILFQHAIFYDQQGKWQDAYESLRLYSAMKGRPNLRAELTMIKACMNLNMGICAVDIMGDARKSFPNSSRLDLAESAIWDVFGFKEKALNVISRTPGGETSPICVSLLYDTGRFNEARSLSEATGVPLPSSKFRQNLRLPSATFSIARNWPPPIMHSERTKKVAELENSVKNASSVYFKSLFDLEIEWHNKMLALEVSNDITSGKYDLEDNDLVQKWFSIGRDEREQVGALYNLAMLAAQQKMYKIAETALIRCSKIMPDSQVLWRAIIALTEGDRLIVAEAYKKCPEDPEIMLAELVTKTQLMIDDAIADRGTSSTNALSLSWGWATNMVTDVIASQQCDPGTLVRAGDYLLSKGQSKLAADLARDSISNGRGLLAAHVLGLRIALFQRNLRWAEACVINGIENAQNPTPFYKTMVDIKASGRKLDNSLMDALEYLHGQNSADPRWAEMLGRVYFQKGDMQRALSIFGSVMAGDTKSVNVRTLILAAEAARRNSKMDRAVSILESAYAMQPDQLSVLNNLVYLLAQNPNTLARARALTPKLLEIGSDSFAVMDTAAMVYLKSGDMEKAQLWMSKAMNALQKDSYSAQEVKLNAAELQMKLGNYKKAREGINELRQDSSDNDYIDQQAQGLLRDIESLSGGGL